MKISNMFQGGRISLLMPKGASEQSKLKMAQRIQSKTTVPIQSKTTMSNKSKNYNDIKQALKERVDRVEYLSSRELRLDIKNCLPTQKKDSFSGDFTDNAAYLTIGKCEGDLDKVDAIRESIKITIFDTQIPTIEQRLEQLETSGLTKDIDWYKVEKTFDLLSNVQLTDSAFNPKSSITYFASKYIALKEQITRDFDGKEQESQIKKLDEIYSKSTEKYAQNMAEELGGIFEKAGVEGEKTKVYQSVKNSLKEKIKQYTEHISKNPNYAEIKEGKDSWMLRCSDYMASQLRTATDKDENNTKEITRDSYSLNQLGNVYDYAMTGVHLMRFSFSGIHAGKDEEIKSATMLLSSQAVGEKLGMSQNHIDALQSILSKKIESSVKNKDLTKEVVEKAMTTYKETGDIRKAVDTMSTNNSKKEQVANSIKNVFERAGLSY